jgi:hypothetical protein
MALAAQFYFGAIFFMAAARRYRATGAVGIDSNLGLLLVAGWTGVTIVGIHEWENYRPRGWGLADVPDYAKTIASLVVGMLLALAPVAASAWAHAVWRRHELLKDPAPMRRPLASVLVIVIATVLVLLIAFAKPFAAPPLWGQVAYSAVIVLVALASVFFLCSWVYYGYPKALLLGFLWVLVMWGGPVFMDLIRYGLADMGETQPIAGIATISPIGALIAIWAELQGVDVRAGIIVQILLMCIPLVLRMMQIWSLRRATADGL